MMKLDVKQQEAVVEALRIQQRAEREQIERYRLAPPAIRSKRYRQGFLLGAALLGTSCFALWYFVGLAFYPLLPVVLTGTALSGWLAEKSERR
ncbi:hypothetical protein CO612_08865 [Lysobacteraceae bacterium NML71-0210]|nr:hypothetical protein CO612_08865 [Xanthomonadaceae bacterium NML71-0210]